MTSLRTGVAGGFASAPSINHAEPISFSQDDSLDREMSRTRDELESLRSRQQQIMDLIGCNKPEKLVHDVRNLLNELQLLKVLADTSRC